LAALVLGVLWFYHWRVTTGDAKAVPEQGGAATVRRLYVLGLSASGLTMTTMALIYLLRWIMVQFGGQATISSPLDVGLTTEITRLIVGVPLWLIFWLWAQRMFHGPSKGERESALRKFYLYGAISVGAMSAVTNATIILASVFRHALGLPSLGDIRVPISIILGMVVLWAYHAFVLRGDAERAGEAPRQAGVRRLYAYLVAGIGLAALLVGLGGDISVLIRSLDESFGNALREQLSWFSAAIIAGLPVWVLPWRPLQSRATEPGPAGTDERRSIVRRIYVYLFLFIATMTVLSGAVFIVYKMLSWALGESAPTLNELGHAIAFSVIAVGVWLYHGSILRGDQRLSDQERVRQLVTARVAVVDVGDGRFGRAVVDALKREVPEWKLEPIVLDAEWQAQAAQLETAELIVGPWTIATPGTAGSTVSPEIARAVADSPARKLLIPLRAQGWEWAGVDRWEQEDLVKQTVHAIVCTIVGDVVKPVRPLSAGTIVLIVIGVLFLLSSLGGLIASFLDL
jgi:hypothetical protein